MKNVMIFVLGMIAGLVMALTMLFQSGHMNMATKNVIYTVETTQFDGFEFQ